VHPAKAVERNETPFGRDTLVVLSKGKILGVRTPVCSDVACRQITLALVIITIIYVVMITVAEITFFTF